jgi:CelD/BcsL family acetyltransferase involved in cellulose biosynthesis
MMSAVAGLARRLKLPMDFVRHHERAALDATLTGVGASDFVSPRKRKELRRQFKHLRLMGAVAFHETRSVEDISARVEEFMLLEANGWKGRKGTAFLNDVGLATFLRETSQELGRDGRFRIYWLSLDGRMIAGNIVLLDGRGGAWFWKTAYDEDFAAMSPGVLLTMDMTDRMLKDSGVSKVDSCAVPNHPMIDHLWRGRLRIVDAMIGLNPDVGLVYDAVLKVERLRHMVKETVKTALVLAGKRR